MLRDGDIVTHEEDKTLTGTVLEVWDDERGTRALVQWDSIINPTDEWVGDLIYLWE